MKKYLFIAMLFVLSLGVFFWLKVPNKTVVNKPGASPAPQAADINSLTPLFPPPVTRGQMSYTITPPSSAFPSSLPLYTAGVQNQKAIVGGVAATLGFKTAPVAFSNAQGVHYVWNEEGASLSVGGSPLEMNYSSGKNASGVVRATPEELGAAAQKHLSSLGLPQEPYKAALASLAHFTLSGFDMRKTSLPAEATVVELSYQYNLENRPFFTGKLNEVGIKVRINSKKEVISSVVVMPPPLLTTNETIAVATIQEGVARLTRGEGVLVALFDEGSNEFSAPQYAASSATVKEIILGYYWGAGQEAVVPVYLFRGSAPDTETGALLTFATIVSALPINQ